MFFANVVATPLIAYPIAPGVAASVYGIGLIALAAMSVGIDSASRYENTMGLSENEFALYASLPRNGTGREFLEKANGGGYLLPWPLLQTFLIRLERLKLVRTKLEGGNPAMVWSKRES
jgi:hypothetical protein